MRAALVFLTLLGGRLRRARSASTESAFGPAVSPTSPARATLRLLPTAGLMDISVSACGDLSINAPGVDVALDRPGRCWLRQTFQNTTAGFAVPFGAARRSSESRRPARGPKRSLCARRYAPAALVYVRPDLIFSSLRWRSSGSCGFDLALGVTNSGFQGAITAQIVPTTNTWSEREIDFKFTEYGPMVGLKLACSILGWFIARRWYGFATPAGLTTAGDGCGDAPRSVGVDACVTDRCWGLPEWRSSR